MLAGVLSPADRTLLSTHGESIEKFLRKRLSDKIRGERFRQFTFGVEMQTNRAFDGRVAVLTGAPDRLSPTADEGRIIEAALAGAVNDLNRALAAEGFSSRYRPVS